VISAIVPARNEEERIEDTVRAIASLGTVDEILVVDDASTDNTAAVAHQAGATVARLEEHSGKGRAMQAGLEAARGDILLLLDADLGESAKEAACLLPPVLRNEADMTIATFPVLPGRGGGGGRVVRLARRGIEARTGRTMQAPLSGQRAVRRCVLDAADGFDEGFGAEVGLTIDALQAGFRVVEVPTNMTHRVTGRGPRDVLHRFRQYLAVRQSLRIRP
jgi:glycosyltransferase involved in cell wall biosynthesis